MKTNRSTVLTIGVLAAVVHAPLAAQGAATWVRVATVGPPGRIFHAMAYDSQRGRTVLFGGAGSSSYLGDTWEWDGSAWQPQLFTSGPAGRNLHAMAYDSQRGRSVLFGGSGVGGYLRDTWEWNGSSWAQVGIGGPSAREGHAMAYDSQRGRTVLFGGYSGGLGQQPRETWEWSGSSWSQVASGGPGARSGHAMAYDSHRHQTVLFGGGFTDTWLWDGSNWTPQAYAGPSSQPSTMGYDTQSGRTVLCQGSAAPWEWNGRNWTPVSASTSPNSNIAMVFDSGRGRSVLFGGGGSTDTWELTSLSFTSTAITFGAGCGSPVLDLAPIASARPSINATAQATLTNIPASLAFVAVGWSRTAFGPFTLPLPLVGYGMPGCSLLQSSEAAALPTASTGASSATFSMPLPIIPSLIGMHVFLQAWAFAPGANPGHTIVSNGIDWGIGNS